MTQEEAEDDLLTKYLALLAQANEIQSALVQEERGGTNDVTQLYAQLRQTVNIANALLLAVGSELHRAATRKGVEL